MRILIVDDDLMVAKSIGGFLTHQMGHHVTVCSNAQEALGLFQEEPFPLVITDIRMPGMSGIDLTRELRRHYRGTHTHILVITGFPSQESIDEALRAGACEYLRKPIDITQLEQIINRLEVDGCCSHHVSAEGWIDRLCGSTKCI